MRPRGYIAAAANEAEKVATIKIVEVRTVGRFGRMFLSGSEADVRLAIETAAAMLEAMEGRA